MALLTARWTDTSNLKSFAKQASIWTNRALNKGTLINLISIAFMQNHPFIKIKVKEPLGLRLLSLWESHRTAVCGLRVLGILTKGETKRWNDWRRIPSRTKLFHPPYYSANLIPEPICQEAYLRVGRKEVRRVVGGLFVPGLLVWQ